MDYPIDDSGVQEALMLDKEHADGKCGDNLYWKLAGDTLHIFGTGELYPWAWKRCFPIPISRVCIEPGCTKIGDSAFSHTFFRTVDRTVRENYRLVSVYIPPTVREIGDNAFRRSGLEALDVPDSVTLIGRNAFLGVWDVCYHGSTQSEDWWGAVKFNGKERPAPEFAGDTEFLDEVLINLEVSEELELPEFDC